MSDVPMSRIQAAATAERMYPEWKVDQIRVYLAARGVNVSWSTVKIWADADYREERLRRERVRTRNAWRERHNIPSSRFRAVDVDECEQILLALRVEDGVQYSALSVIARRFYGFEMTPEHIRYRLCMLGATTNPNKGVALRRRLERQAA